MQDTLKGEAKYPHINRSYIKDLNKLESDIDTWDTQGMAAKFFYMRTWLQNINFHAGNQWLTYDEHKQIFELQPQLDDEIKLTVNKILPAIRMAVGKLLMDRKRPIVLQLNQDEEEIESAKVKTKFLEHNRRVNDGIHTEKKALTWSTLTGKGISKQWYDVETDQPVIDIIPTFEFLTPPNVLEMKKFPWAAHKRFESRSWVYENYGIDVEGTSDWGQYGMFLAAVKNIMQDGNYTGVYTQGMEDNVMVEDWWIRPCKEYPDGLVVIRVNKQVIFADRNPYVKLKKIKRAKNGVMLHKDFYWPFAELDFFDAPYRYWPISLVEGLIDPQKWLNEFYSDNIQNLQYANSPTHWAQEGTVVADEVSMKPGSINFYTGQQPPTPNNPRAIDASIFSQAGKLEQSISEVAGIHFFGPGSLPPGVHAAAALAIINEQDQMAAMTVSVNHEKWLKDISKQTLYLVRNWGPDKILIRVMGDEGQWEVKEFKKSDISGDEEIHIESKQQLASDKMTKFDQVIKLMTTLGGDQKPLIDTEMGLRLLDLEKDMGMVTPRALNRNMQMDENQKLWEGKEVNVYEWEDHKAHIEALLEEMLTIKFKQADEKVQRAFMTHYRSHQQFMNAAQQQGQASSQVGQTPQLPPMQSAQEMPPNNGFVPPHMGGHGMPPMQHPAQQAMPGFPSGLSGALQGGMTRVMNEVTGRPGGI
ncbi:hypothetical protein SD70_27235 [Gordoniibacillus kamchatkensis]|uniref:Portal protein n=1 Tax=Gordoniibacillus kamchatkensis TaxID=1590651 RepID=A0ABR5ABE9_9BACL|nr:DUF1720 domain-containing protein [Paenibacillus sp. VKM B-2647]KIL38312.1 hypothetical protein SD70_27235 [Paenibacillus sp. VKM B-2647]